MPDPLRIDRPTRLDITPQGSLTPFTRHYEKHLGDMGEVYRDDSAWRSHVSAAGPDRLVYSVDEQKYHDGPGALIVGTSTLQAGVYGDEFAMTRGHLHAVSDRAELYHCLSGHGVLLLETVGGETTAVELRPGQAVNVPGDWLHRSVNVGVEPFVTLFTYAADAGQDYEMIRDAHGMKSLVVRREGGWALTPNPDHVGYRRAELG